MATESESGSYERAVELAEAGQHEQALGRINQQLKANPNDGQAWNDAGAILYCLGRVNEAIEYFEKAKGLCPESAEIYWNLAEAYLDGGFPGFAAKLFDGMERLDILTADLINRTANAFLLQEYYGNAVEMLLRSLEMSPGQEILQPMIEVIRSKRPKVAFFRGAGRESAEEVFDFVKHRFMAELHVAESFEQIRPIMDWCDIAWFEGCGEVTVEASWQPRTCQMIVRLGTDDVYETWPEQVKWENVNALIATGNPFFREELIDKVGDIEKRTRVVTIERGADAGRSAFTNKQRGKRIACVGDLSAKSNPMLLLQCMQKLHYLDADYRLYFAAEFEDKSVEQYVKYMVEVLGLSSVVFFDGKPKNMDAWFRDKHYVVATGIAQGGVVGVLEGMACGLKPVVHNFPGAGRILPAEFLFNLAEDFCRQILSERYEPAGYRAIVEQRYNRKCRMKEINEVLVRIEKDIAEQKRALEGRRSCQDRFDGFGAVADDVNQWQRPEYIGVATGRTGAEDFPGNDDSQLQEPARSGVLSRPEAVSSQITPPTAQLPAKAIPIEPIKPEKLNIRIKSPGVDNQETTGPVGVPCDVRDSLNQKQPVPRSPAVSGGIGSISEMAAEAVRASRALAQAANQSGTLPTQAGWDTVGAGPADLSQMGYDSLETSVEAEKTARVASEFSEDERRRKNRVKRVKVNQVPFVS